MHRKGSVGDNRVYTLRRRNAKKRIPDGAVNIDQGGIVPATIDSSCCAQPCSLTCRIALPIAPGCLGPADNPHGKLFGFPGPSMCEAGTLAAALAHSRV